MWVVEQMPGACVSADQTSVLRQYTYWASYNIPFYTSIFEESGFTMMKDLFGDFFSYSQTPRAKIFLRNHSDVVNVTTMQRLMRYNNWALDELSAIPNCTGCNPNPQLSPYLSIAARGDLSLLYPAPPANPIYAHFFRRSPFGSTDSKMVTSEVFERQGSYVVVGPTADDQPPFSWSSFGAAGPAGAPDVYNFSWVNFSVVLDLLPPQEALQPPGPVVFFC